MGGVELAVAEPSRDGGDVDPALEQVHRGGVADHMGRDTDGVAGTEPSAHGETMQDVGNSRSAEASGLGIEEECSIVGAPLAEPCVDGVDRPWPERTGSPLPTLSFEDDDGDWVEAEVAEVDVDDFLDPGSCVVEDQEQGPISTALGLDGLGQSSDFTLFEVLDFGVLESGGRDLADPAAALEMLGSDGGDIAREGFEDGESLVAGPSTALSLVLEPADRPA